MFFRMFFLEKNALFWSREIRCFGPQPPLVFSYMGYIGLCDPKGFDFSAVLVINRVWFLHSWFEFWVSVLGKASFSPKSMRPSGKALHDDFSIVLN